MLNLTKLIAMAAFIAVVNILKYVEKKRERTEKNVEIIWQDRLGNSEEQEYTRPNVRKILEIKIGGNG